MLNTPYLLAIPVLLVIYNLCGYLLRRPRQALSYPPGPRGLPIIGSFFDMLTPRTEHDAQWAIYRDMGSMYHSDVLHIDVLGDHTVVLNSAKAAEELLERRSGIYSSRPTMRMANESGNALHIMVETSPQDFPPVLPFRCHCSSSPIYSSSNFSAPQKSVMYTVYYNGDTV
ncbi:hypothetical protein D9758_006605 [Tetrapyrgos nigripes]|uniref:Cytochrome P450 n=1 Tax=Tetrapyrgos nigripes TaxID=182062 RepID=A0A8H5GJT4_9AGAR|nr:hypothetical protein D9758_006605 [Tetrapyrgos nigripes]